MPVTVLIAEDDPQMRLVLKRILEESQGIRVVGEAADGAGALAMFDKFRPSAVFLDIDMPFIDGITLAREIFKRDPLTYLVFITAYDQFRAEAFEVYAYDYLVKPFKLDRLRQTIKRLRLHIDNHKVGSRIGLGDAREHKEGMKLFRAGSRLVLLHLKDIIFITKEGRDTVIYHTGGRLKTKDSLDALEEELGEYPFVRTHKGFIVNLKMIKQIVRSGSCYEIIMAHTGKRALMTAEKLRRVEMYLGAKKHA
ncbi:MAG: LytTR family DNA-binding domain-containing protein [Bacillota bacterium]